MGFTFFSHWKEHRSTCKPPPGIHEAPGTAVISKAKGMEAEGVWPVIERVLKIQN